MRLIAALAVLMFSGIAHADMFDAWNAQNGSVPVSKEVVGDDMVITIYRELVVAPATRKICNFHILKDDIYSGVGFWATPYPGIGSQTLTWTDTNYTDGEIHTLRLVSCSSHTHASEVGI